MPEGDTVFRAAARLRSALAGKVLTRSDFRVPRYATVDLTGQLVESVGSYGKHLFVRTATASVHTHLKMEGIWRTYHCGQRWSRPRANARLVLATEDVEAVGFDLGKVEVLPIAEEHTVIDHLGPDLLGPNWDPGEAVRRLARYPRQTIGVALLDQRNLAGVGNIYRSEVCYLRKVHPATPVGEVPDLLAMVNEAQRILDKAAHERYVPLAFNRHRWPCRRCGTRIVRRVLGDSGPEHDRVTQRERGIWFCPRCQPEPA